MKYAITLSLAALFALIGCKPPQTYEWGNYEGSLYGLMKDPSSLDKYGRSLQRQIQDADGSGKVPPGIFAEYGYFLTVTNQSGEAIKYFEKEKQRWPESARLMDKMISNCKSPRTPQAAQQPFPETASVARVSAVTTTATPVPASSATPAAAPTKEK